MEPVAAGPTTSGSRDTSGAIHPSQADESSAPRIAHTLTACIRCKQRKSRCDPGIPRCEPCKRSNSKCEYYDHTKETTISRTYILELREKIRQLGHELEELEDEADRAPDAEAMARGAGLIKFKETDESRFLGPSSGIAITRFVMDMAKQNTGSKSIKEVVNDNTAQQIKSVFDIESQKPTSKVFPMISSVAEPNLPPRELTNKLVDIFMAKGMHVRYVDIYIYIYIIYLYISTNAFTTAQYMVPILHEPTFRSDVDVILNGSQDPCQNFQLRLVIAISMQRVSAQYAGLADSYYLAALPYFDGCLAKMDISTLQCCALMALYSLLTPTRTAAYWVVGVAAKICQDLGISDEETITKGENGQTLSFLEIDMRRRLFWIITSMEYGLAHSLGRPNSFCVSHDHVNVNFFQTCDDRYITPGGVLPGAQPIMKKCIAIHFFKMRLLQAEIRRKLYLCKRPTPLDDRDPWFAQMLNKMDRWVELCPKNDEGSGFSQLWFQGRRNTMIVFMYRPSPQIPEPSLHAAQRCYDASVFNVKIQREQVATGSVDLTWIFTQSVFMALNTILWSLSYPEIRKEHPVEDVIAEIRLAMEILAISSERWPGVESALELYKSLISGCLKAYSTDESYVVHSPPSNRPSPDPGSEYATPPPMSHSPNTATVPSPMSQPRSTPNQLSSSPYDTTHSHASFETVRLHPGQPKFESTTPSPHTTMSTLSYDLTPSQQSNYTNGNGTSIDPNSRSPAQPFSSPEVNHLAQCDISPESRNHFDPSSFHNNFPSVLPGLHHWDPNYTTASTTASYLTFPSAAIEPMSWIGTIGDQYSQFYNQPYQSSLFRDRRLSYQEHEELMNTLGHDLPDVSQLVEESATFYSSSMIP
ncbi:fungal specific transcription factor domain-containing protein [Arthroderma uncinatum]|uniref:fungal specific transcription factor domain-containing protein n=1 Tax=Arthroderma uncinatum TaxID=74035 RepID=UPI00144AE655|nr:fungal specific transcription factor domain-containing protein [Arthroderma uncinatum]KAF3480226.1 fungal specific transcription factor domain-containing protein [Arthroderma uncinatum]